MRDASKARKMVIFRGEIVTGVGKYSELSFPGRYEITEAPQDWPNKLYPGSLNVMVRDDGYPEGFTSPPIGPGVQKFDDHRMDAAIAEAKSTLDTFVAALKAGSEGTAGFAVKKGFTYGPDGKEFIWVGDVSLDEGMPESQEGVCTG